MTRKLFLVLNLFLVLSLVSFLSCNDKTEPFKDQVENTDKPKEPEQPEEPEEPTEPEKVDVPPSPDGTHLPEGTRENYMSYYDNSISDEFNSNTLDLAKWGRRNTGGYMVADHHNDSSLVTMESYTYENGDEVKYVSLKGIIDPSRRKAKGSGIVSRSTGFYGFYVVRFRYQGFDNAQTREFGNIWHPAIWSGRLSNVEGEQKATSPADFWIEIDLMEWGNKSWDSDAPARLVDSKGERRKVVTQGPGLEKGIMKDKVERYDNGWQTIGLEYSPEHLKIWEWKDGQWSHMGDRVVNFVEDDLEIPESKYTISTIGKKSRTPCFWLLSNVISPYMYDEIENGTTKRAMNDMSFDIDFFRYYRHVEAENMNWKWQNGLPEGGGPIQRAD